MICKYCKKEKPQEDFKKCSVVNGVTYYRLKCSTCKQATQRERIKKCRKRFEDYKKTLACQDCNSIDFRVFEFHHLDPKEKEHDVANLTGTGASLEKIKKELAKCVVLCANCHRIRHYKERSGVPSET